MRSGEMIARPDANEYAQYYGRYISLVSGEDLLDVLGKQGNELKLLLSGVTPDRELYRYAEGKWNIRQVLGHIIDGERVFGFRAYCFSRGEKAEMPSFDENVYVERSVYSDCSVKDLVAEFETIRIGNLAFFRRLEEKAWKNMGTASAHPVSVRALGYIMAGHVTHHCNVLVNLYGVIPPVKK
jgi:hypothetical protein